jgi:hypothetical protein
MIDHSLNQIPQPLLVTITKVYDDNNHVDCKTKNEEELTYIQTIGTPVTEATGLLMFLENDDMIIITK